MRRTPAHESLGRALCDMPPFVNTLEYERALLDLGPRIDAHFLSIHLCRCVCDSYGGPRGILPFACMRALCACGMMQLFRLQVFCLASRCEPSGTVCSCRPRPGLLLRLIFLYKCICNVCVCPILYVNHLCWLLRNRRQAGSSCMINRD
jgi:hypothetical protein